MFVNLFPFRTKLDEWIEAIHIYADYLPHFGNIKFYILVDFEIEYLRQREIRIIFAFLERFNYV